MTEAEAEAFFDAINAEGGSVTYTSIPESHPTIPVGDVIRFDPPAGDYALPDQHVDIYVSTGPSAGGGAGAFLLVRFGGLLQGAS